MEAAWARVRRRGLWVTEHRLGKREEVRQVGERVGKGGTEEGG